MNNKKNQPSEADTRRANLAPVSGAHDAADTGISRRGFLGFAAASIFLVNAGQQSRRLESRNGIPYRTLGRSKEKVSLIGLGGYHLGNQADPQESIRIIRTGLDEVVNFLDNCPGGAKGWQIRHIGFTGHKGPDIHLKMLTTALKHGFTFDAVQMPLNVMDAHFDSFEKKVLPVLLKNDIGVLGMKPMGDHVILESKTATPVECLHYAMNLPTSVVITGCYSLPILQQALQAARSFQPMNPSQVAALLAKTAKAAEAGKFELYKTSHRFDGTYANPQWLG